MTVQIIAVIFGIVMNLLTLVTVIARVSSNYAVLGVQFGELKTKVNDFIIKQDGLEKDQRSAFQSFEAKIEAKIEKIGYFRCDQHGCINKKRTN